MIIVWKGWGIIIPISFVAFILVFGSVLADANQPLSKTIVPSISFLLTGVVCFFSGRYWRKKEGEMYFDDETKEQVLIKKVHSFFWIDVYYWAFICAVLALLSFYLFIK